MRELPEFCGPLASRMRKLPDSAAMCSSWAYNPQNRYQRTKRYGCLQRRQISSLPNAEFPEAHASGSPGYFINKAARSCRGVEWSPPVARLLDCRAVSKLWELPPGGPTCIGWVGEADKMLTIGGIVRKSFRATLRIRRILGGHVTLSLRRPKRVHLVASQPGQSPTGRATPRLCCCRITCMPFGNFLTMTRTIPTDGG